MSEIIIGNRKRELWRLGLVLAVLMLAALVVAAPRPAHSADPVLPISKVQPGMVGYAKTVTTGTVVTTFTVEVVSVLMNENYPGGDLILFRASGPVIDRTRGIVSGMSGSPIYLVDPDDLQEKVAGAISYGAEFADATLALATPIEEMQGILALGKVNPALPNQEPARFVPRDGKAVNLGGGRVLSAAVPKESAAGSLPAGTALLKRISPVVTISGISPASRGYGRIQEAIQKRGFPVTPSPGSSAVYPDASGATMEPGASLGVALVTGDTTIAGIGTVTYVDNNKVLGFGHPLLWMAKTDYPMTTGYVHSVWPGDFGGAGFKLASAGETTGTILQDRAKGVAGELGRVPLETTVTASVENVTEATSATRRYGLSKGVQSAAPEFGAVLAQGVILGANDGIFENPKGTADVTLTVTGSTATGKSFSLELGDKIFDPGWVGYAATDKMFWALLSLLDNGLADVDIDEISYSASFEATRKTARIVNASLGGRSIRASSTATVTVDFIPYNSETTETVETTIAIPAGFPSTGELRVSGGMDGDGGFEPDYPMMTSGFSSSATIDGIIDGLESEPRGNEIVISLQGYGPVAPIQKRVATGWVQSGWLSKEVPLLTMSASSAVNYGSAAAFSGYLYGDFSGTPPTVELWARPYGSTEATMVKQVRTQIPWWMEGEGAYYSTSWVPTSTGVFWTRFAGDEDHTDVVSSSRTVSVRGKLTLRANRSSLRLGSRIYFTGTLRPAHVSSRVYVQYLRSGRWYNLTSGLTNSSSNLSASWVPRARGRYYFRTYWAGDGSHAAGASNVISVAIY
ncbi:MAG: hypothetical protein C4521_03205 [Actinobacteria bacterium]|nr:MAG: hypothetical protein C4521_03205 [Actinomycetota bacterium]